MRAAPACTERSRDPDGDDEAHKSDQADAKRAATRKPHEEARSNTLLVIPNRGVFIRCGKMLRFKLRLRLRGFRLAWLDEFGTCDVVPVFAQRLEVLGGVGMSALRGARQSFFRFGESARAGQQHRQFKRAVGIAALVSAVVGGRGALEVSALLE